MSHAHAADCACAEEFAECVDGGLLRWIGGGVATTGERRRGGGLGTGGELLASTGEHQPGERIGGATAHIVRATSTWRVASIMASHEPSASKHARGDKGEAASRGSELTAWAELVVLDGAGRFVEAAWAQSK